MGDEELRRVGERTRELNWGAELESWGSYMELRELRRVGNWVAEHWGTAGTLRGETTSDELPSALQINTPLPPPPSTSAPQLSFPTSLRCPTSALRSP